MSGIFLRLAGAGGLGVQGVGWGFGAGRLAGDAGCGGVLVSGLGLQLQLEWSGGDF